MKMNNGSGGKILWDSPVTPETSWPRVSKNLLAVWNFTSITTSHQCHFNKTSKIIIPLCSDTNQLFRSEVSSFLIHESELIIHKQNAAWEGNNNILHHFCVCPRIYNQAFEHIWSLMCIDIPVFTHMHAISVFQYQKWPAGRMDQEVQQLLTAIIIRCD